MQRRVSFVVGAAALAMAFSAAAQKPIAYPAKGQNPQQQSKDDGDCYVWAREQTGIDPAAGGGAPPPAESTGQAAARGAMRGAVAGAAVGAIGGHDVGNAAAKGAVVGGVYRGAKAKGQQQAAQQQSAQAMQTYYRAWGACMSGRGYTVN